MACVHDAEVQAVRLDSGQRTDGKPSLLVTLGFEGIEAVGLDGFGPQNVLDDLVVGDCGNKAPGAARILVSLPSNNGRDGSFRREEAIVLAVSDFEPGPHSVARTATASQRFIRICG